ncbi:diacylglycerol kinase [Pelagirhabdus alkalitolerans]|uniref:Diacylglycerol kinase n=1 Tax=Pelagirhabdus alkalitolerans TaxID=1612202 RepID=A0A1G6IRR3_9BACI|nr:diacylglycerol kinase [Pelagirhabdus alkalitolerans]SDC09113.1 diacylglycerol kinase [Pelagirhabdus alkalitolerans]
MKRARIIYNPTSGREAFKQKLPDILVKFEEAGYVTSAHRTRSKGDATTAATKACEDEFDIVVAVGGDGTINEVVTGISNQSYRPKLGIIPAGTTNDFARALKIPKSFEKAVDVILDNNIHALDVGQVNDCFFVNIAGGGKLTEVSYEVPSKLKTVLGQLAYVMKGVEMLPRFRPIHTRIEYDDEVFEGEIMLFLIANSNSVGGFEKLAQNAKMNDGLFDLFVLKKTNMAEFARVITAALRGQHVNDPNILHVQARDIKVVTDEKMQLNIDGEYGGVLPGHFVNLQEHIEFFLPTEDQQMIEDDPVKQEYIEKLTTEHDFEE